MSQSKKLFIRIRLSVIFIAFLVLIVGLSIPFYLNLKMAGIQAEAKITMAYIAALQEAHFADTGSYVAIPEAYGASIQGKETCERPEGAVELGFTIKGCGKDPRKGGVRYAYRVFTNVETLANEPESNKRYRIEAISGSDVNGESFVCRGSKNNDIWHMGPDRKPKHVASCKDRSS